MQAMNRSAVILKLTIKCAAFV